MRTLKYIGLGTLITLLLFAGSLLPAAIKLLLDNLYAGCIKAAIF
jgi:hypothetical protein